MISSQMLMNSIYSIVSLANLNSSPIRYFAKVPRETVSPTGTSWHDLVLIGGIIS